MTSGDCSHKLVLMGTIFKEMKERVSVIFTIHDYNNSIILTMLYRHFFKVLEEYKESYGLTTTTSTRNKSNISSKVREKIFNHVILTTLIG
jgi:hypothetical protein